MKQALLIFVLSAAVIVIALVAGRNSQGLQRDSAAFLCPPTCGNDSVVLDTGPAVIQTSPDDELPLDRSEQAFAESSAEAEPGIVGIPALPSLAGYTTPYPARNGRYAYGAAGVMAREERDPIWASETESEMLRIASQTANEPMYAIETECRTSICGLVLNVDDGFEGRGSHRVIQTEIIDRLAMRAASASSAPLAEDSRMVVLYFYRD